MADTSVIRELLFALGFKVDPASYAKFEKGIDAATKAAGKMALVVEAAATAVDVAVVKMAASLDNLYWASQRIGSSVQNIKAFDYAIGQLGGTAAGARSALEGIAYFIRANPNAPRFLAERFGITDLRDTEKVAERLGKRFREMPQFRAMQYAQMMGIDYNTMLAMERGPDAAANQSRGFAKMLGLGPDGGSVAANKFMTTIRTLRMEIGLLITKIGVDLITKWGPPLKKFVEGIDWAKSIAGIERWVERIASFGLALFKVGGQIINFLIRADKATGGWSTGIIGLMALLGPSGLMSILALLSEPLGAIIAAVVALTAGLAVLFSDMKTWTQGGSSLIDWSPWGTQVKALVTDTDALWKSIGKLAGTLKTDLGPAFSTALGGALSFIDHLAQEMTHIFKAMDAALHGDWATAGKEAWAAWTSSPLYAALHAAAQAGTDVGTNIHRDLTQGNGSVSDRNNNPGNLTDPATGKFRHFATMDEGWAAMKNQIMIDYNRHGQKTIRQLINDRSHGWSNQWAPGNSAASTGNYIASVSRALGVDPDTPINMNNPGIMSKLVVAMNTVERGGRMASVDGARLGAGGAHVNIATTTNVTVHGAGDAHGTAKQVRREIDRSHSDTFRNFVAAVK